MAAGQMGPQVAVPEEIVTVPISAIVGTIIGGIAGYFAGEEVGRTVYDYMFEGGVTVGR